MSTKKTDKEKFAEFEAILIKSIHDQDAGFAFETIVDAVKKLLDERYEDGYEDGYASCDNGYINSLDVRPISKLPEWR